MKPATDSLPPITVRAVDYANPRDAAALVDLLDGYARDVAGGGKPLEAGVKQGLAQALRQRQPQAFSVMAWVEEEGAASVPHAGVAVGLVNCFEGFSTFACKPLVNVHDVAVLAGYRGQRIGEQMLALAETIARERGACKLTLEVLSGNTGAEKLYRRVGFAYYELDPAMGQAGFMQKWLD